MSMVLRSISLDGTGGSIATATPPLPWPGMDHVLIRRLEHLTGSSGSPALRFGVEIRDRPGPLHKNGAFEDDTVAVQLHGGLFVARAMVRLCWVGEYSSVDDVRDRTRGS